MSQVSIVARSRMLEVLPLSGHVSIGLRVVSEPEYIASLSVPLVPPRRLLLPLRLHGSRVVVLVENSGNRRMQLIDSLDVGLAFFGYVNSGQMSLLLLDVVVVQCPRLWLLDLVGQSEVGLACLLRRDYLHIVHVDLIHSVVMLRPVELSENLFSKLVVGLEVPGLMLPDKLVHVGVYGHLVLVQLFSELAGIDVSLGVVLDGLGHLFLELVARLP